MVGKANAFEIRCILHCSMQRTDSLGKYADTSKGKIEAGEKED